MVDIEANLRDVRRRIKEAAQRAGRDLSEITLVAVTKTVPVEAIREAYNLGLRHFGENRVGEAADKIRPTNHWIQGASPHSPVEWHMVGHLQSRKAKIAVEIFDVIDSVDSFKLAREIDKRCGSIGKTMPILLEVNVSGEVSKYGFRIQTKEEQEDFLSAVERIIALSNVKVRGLMTMAPIVADPEEVRPHFRRLKELRDELVDRLPAADWRHLSMGMTDDYEVAVEEGATLVRIGRAIFEERQAL